MFHTSVLKNSHSAVSRMWAFVALTVFIAIPLHASTISLDSGYFINGNSNRALGEFSLEMNDLYNYALDSVFQLSSDSPLGTMAIKSYFLFALLMPYNHTQLVILPYHEYGHGRMSKALGYDVTYRTVRSFSAGDYGDESDSYFSFILSMYANLFQLSGAQQLSNGNSYSHLSGQELDQYSALVSASGVNNEMYLAQLLSDSLYMQDRPTIFNALLYTNAKLGVFSYANDELNGTFGSGGGDLSSVQSFYQTQHGLNYSFDDFKRDNLLAFALSATTWAYIFGTYNFLLNDRVYVKPLTYANFRLPEVDYYLNWQGPSYRIRSSYRADNSLEIPFYIEYVVSGIHDAEGGIGFQKRWSRQWASCTMLTIGKALSAEQSVTYFPSTTLAFQFGWRYFNVQNLSDSRHILSLEDASGTDHELWVRSSLYF